jgi:hypothetical protein
LAGLSGISPFQPAKIPGYSVLNQLPVAKKMFLKKGWKGAKDQDL